MVHRFGQRGDGCDGVAQPKLIDRALVGEVRDDQLAADASLVRYRLGRARPTAPVGAPCAPAVAIDECDASGAHAAQLSAALHAARAESDAFDERLRRLLI